MTTAPDATRVKRLAATAIDALLTIAMVVLVTLASGVFEVAGPYLNGTIVLWAAALVVISYVLLHGWTLLTASQTLGKKIIGLQVVDDPSFERASIVKLAVRASCIWWLIFIPAIGMWLQLLHAADALMLFFNKKQALHDRIARTRVIDTRDQHSKPDAPTQGIT